MSACWPPPWRPSPAPGPPSSAALPEHNTLCLFQAKGRITVIVIYIFNSGVHIFQSMDPDPDYSNLSWMKLPVADTRGTRPSFSSSDPTSWPSKPRYRLGTDHTLVHFLP